MCIYMKLSLLFLYRPSELAFVLYRVSFLWYSLLSLLLTVGMGMLVSVLYHCLLSGTEKKTRNQPHDSVVSKPTAATCSNMNPAAYKLLLKEEQMKDEDAATITYQGKVPAALLCKRDM